MIKLKLYPPSGTIEDAKALKFELSGIEAESFRVRVENATHGSSATVASLQNMGDGVYMGFAHIKIPDHYQQSAISIFAHVEEKIDDSEYKTIQICPTIFTIKNFDERVKSPLWVTPAFIGPEDLCSVRLDGKPNSKKVISVNDKFFRTIINKDGIGSVNFKGSDVIGDEDIESVRQLPIYVYDEEDNFTHKVFSDSYLNILPSSISMHAVIDPRCDPDDDDYVIPGTWILPDACLDDPGGPDPFIVKPGVPPNGLPTSCKEETVIIDHASTCKIFSHSATLLNNGMSMHAYLSPDKTIVNSNDDLFNINKVFLAKQETSLDVQIIANRDVVVEPKSNGENFRIHVEEDLWNALDIGNLSAVPNDNPSNDNPSNDNPSNDIHVVLFNYATGFQSIRIIDKEIDPYTGNFVVIGVVDGDRLLIREWVFCVNSVFYHATEDPSLNMDVTTNPIDLPYIYDSDYDPLQIINVDISSNVKYVGENEESYVYIIAESLDDGKSQLFLNSIMICKDSSVATTIGGWKKLTYGGNNTNPVAEIGQDNNLHITWESDRSGLKQIYYGVLGVSSISSSCPALSSSIDKYSSFLSGNDYPFDYTSVNLFSQIGNDVYSPSYQTPEYDSSDLVSANFTGLGGGGGMSSSAGSSYIQDVIITANGLSADVIAFNQLQIFDSEDLSQFNYQFSFDLSVIPTQSSSLASSYQGLTINEFQMDNIFNEWKSGFASSVDSNIENQSVYIKDGNTFALGRTDEIFDRIVPFAGSYNKDLWPDGVTRFQLDIRDESCNLKDFSFGIMFEKTRFTATNIYSSSDFTGDDPSAYIDSENHIIYTGMAKMVAFIKTEDVESDRANYIIVREFPEKINILDDNSYTIIGNYTKLDSHEVIALLDTYGQTYSSENPSIGEFGPSRFMGQVTMLIDGVPRFSQSFISTLSSDYNYFDIGIGVPYGGYYIADKMTPSKMGIFDDVDVSMIFTDMSITSPTYSYNTDAINLPSHIRDMTKLRVVDSSPPVQDDLLNLNIDMTPDGETVYFIDRPLYGTGASNNESFDTSLVDVVSILFASDTLPQTMTITNEDGYVLDSTGPIIDHQDDPISFDIDVTSINSITITITGSSAGDGRFWSGDFKSIAINNIFSQIPITFEGINQFPCIDLGICEDAHIAWQSNRNKYWNIFYSNASNSLSPFRFDTIITDTESNSLRPSVSVNRNGSRLITWHDDRNGKYDIFSARSTEGYSCDQNKCRKEMAESFDDNIVECDISIEHDAIAGIYSLSLEFYKDAALKDLHTIIHVDEDTRGRWFVDRASAVISYDDNGDVQGVIFLANEDVTISYMPDKSDGIFDMILYVKLTSSEVTG